ncbi:hypothetical protein [Streptomyces sp. NPDC101237]|uniref:hypothetical protein n=1 Tax=Streptomyces sp. NPDC101237 TaxID=3366139 RepID=UPI003813EF72
MGTKPSAASHGAATRTTTSSINVASTNAMATEPAPPAAAGHFGMPHALVIIGFIAGAAILAPHGMTIRDSLFLLGGSGSIGASAVVMVTTGYRGANRVKRLMDAYRSSGH